MQRMHVDVRGVVLDDGGGHVIRPQDRAGTACFLARDPADRAGEVGIGREILQTAQLPRVRDVQRAALAHQRMLAEALRRGMEEVAAGTGQRAHRGVAVDLREQRGGAPGRVITREILALENGDAMRACQLRRRRSARDPRTDDDDVEGPVRHAVLGRPG